MELKVIYSLHPDLKTFCKRLAYLGLILYPCKFNFKKKHKVIIVVALYKFTDDEFWIVSSIKQIILNSDMLVIDIRLVELNQLLGMDIGFLLSL